MPFHKSLYRRRPFLLQTMYIHIPLTHSLTVQICTALSINDTTHIHLTIIYSILSKLLKFSQRFCTRMSKRSGCKLYSLTRYDAHQTVKIRDISLNLAHLKHTRCFLCSPPEPNVSHEQGHPSPLIS